MYLDKERLTDTFCYIEQGLSIGFDIFEDLEGQQLTNFRSKWRYLLVMSSSWNFPAWASQSYEGSEPSQAEPLKFWRWNQAENFLSTN